MFLVKSRYSNYQDLLKFIAIITMIIDHLGLYWFPDIMEMRIIGRYAMPLFMFFAGYNFKHRMNFYILLAGTVTYAISTIFIHGFMLEANILISIFLGQIYLYFFHKYLSSLTIGYVHFIILASLWPWTKNLTDYGSLSIALMIIGYMVKVNAIRCNLAALIVGFCSALHSYVNFYGFFNDAELIFSAFVGLLIYVSLRCGNFSNVIAVNLRIISRYSLQIYVVHLLIIEFVWRYYIYSA